MPLMNDGNDTLVSPNPHNADGFGRFRVSSPNVLFEANFVQNSRPLDFTQFTSGSGAVTRNANEVSMNLTTSTASGDVALYQSKKYHHYIPGQSFLIFLTGKFSTTQSGLVQRFGYFDDNNGFFFELNGTTLNVVRRTSISGSVVETRIAQSNWNIDKMDGQGEGPSDVLLDVSKQQIFLIDFQWLGSGRVRLGLDIDGVVYYVHEFLHANILDVPYSQTGTLPVRAEIRNTTAISSASNLRLTCTSVISEGQTSLLTYSHSVNTGVDPRDLTASFLPVLSIRLKAANNRAQIIPRKFSAYSANNDPVLVEIRLNATLTGGSWISAGANSIAEYNTTSTAVAGGEIIDSFYINEDNIFNAGFASTFQSLNSDYNGTADTLTICAVRMSVGADFAAAITFDELF